MSIRRGECKSLSMRSPLPVDAPPFLQAAKLQRRVDPACRGPRAASSAIRPKRLSEGRRMQRCRIIWDCAAETSNQDYLSEREYGPQYTMMHDYFRSISGCYYLCKKVCNTILFSHLLICCDGILVCRMAHKCVFHLELTFASYAHYQNNIRRLDREGAYTNWPV